MSTTAPKFKLAVSNTVAVPMKFSLNDNGVIKKHAFTLHAERLSQEAFTARVKEKGEELISSFMAPLITGWQGQRLVLDLADQPADFSPDALEALFSVAGVAMVAYASYQKVLAASEKN